MKVCKIIAAISFVCFGFFSVNSQCPNTYFKPLSYSLFSGQNNFINISTGNDDFNDDGRADIIGYKSNSPNVYIYLSNDQNGFDSPITINTPAAIFSDYVKPADFESDGDLDFVVQNQTSPQSVTVYQNNGSGSFTPLTDTIINDFNLVSVVDINGDNLSDLFTFNGNGGSNYYRLGNANGTFGVPVQVEYADYHLEADFNNDGDIDFPRRNNLTGKLEILHNQGNGVFLIQPTDHNTSQIQDVKDLNNDNLPDLIVRYDSTRIQVILNNGNNNFSPTIYHVPVRSGCCGNPTMNPFVGEFTGDGFPDIMITDHRKPYYSIYQNNGSGVFSRIDYNVKAVGEPFGDIDGDNKTDLVSISNSLSNVFGYQNIIVQRNSCVIQGATKIVDFDGNGSSDRTVWNASQGLWKSHFLQQNDGSTSDITFHWGMNGDLTAPGDYDGDGATDYAVFRPSNGVWYIRKSSDGTFLFINFGLDGDIPVAFDYDGDDKTDIAVFRPSNGVWYALRSSDNQFYGLQWGISEDKPVPADYDGDGKTDVAVFRPSNGVWYILKSSDNQFYGLQWGISDDHPVPADFDGDGKADIAVRRSTDNIWYIIGSYNNQFLGYTFGTSEDIVQPGDWNGNGVFDAGVFRPSTKIWYSSANINGELFGSDGDTPIGSLSKIY